MSTIEHNMIDSTFDFIVVGGGTAGCVVASRLSQSGKSVALFEAGPEDYNEKIMSPLGAPTLHGTSVEYNYQTKKQPHLLNRQLPNYGGRLLSGSSAVNYGNWTRCHSTDYDAWASLVHDSRWSYQGLLKYFKKLEHHHDPAADREIFGFDGPIHTTGNTRHYPLRDPIRKALTESGLPFNANANAGNPLGFAALTENWKDGKRQPAGLAYDLGSVTVFSNAQVKRIVLEGTNRRAIGIELIDDRHFRATKEILICCGAIKTPQLLMLSGIGPAKDLASYGIDPLIDLPVGKNLHDHLSATLYWKLKSPEDGLAIGSPKFMRPEFKDGNPIDWIVTASISDPSDAAKMDGLLPNDPLISQPRGHTEIFFSYAPIAAPAFFDRSIAGTHISSPVLGLLPTSRGTITLASSDPMADPVIDPNYLDTELDRQAMMTGVRIALNAMLGTPTGKTFIQDEEPPPGEPQLSCDSTDQELSRRIQTVGRSFYQCAGTAAMGTVVDTQLRLKGVSGLRVVDASILPLPLAGHYQCAIYAIAEAAADLILQSEQ